MIPRPYQRRFVDRAIKSLKSHDSTLGIAATGAGKTIMMGFTGLKFKGMQLVLQHRHELVEQNSRKYGLINPDREIGFIAGNKKTGFKDTTFAMAQTLVNNLELIPKGLKLVIIDEAHHACAPGYVKIINAIKEKSPKVKILGVTATPERSDKKTLRAVFESVCDHITIKELVALGHLVKPVGMARSLGSEVMRKLSDARITTNYGDQSEVAEIFDHDNINRRVVDEWKELACDRRTIVFCSNVKHAEHVRDAYRDAGITCECVEGSMPKGERDSILKRFDAGMIQVITNVFVLTEGYDSQPVSCVVLLRQCSEKGPMIQMAGRGLRKVNPEEYPGINKSDCLILDFGTSLITHGNLDQSADLPMEKVRDGAGFDMPTKRCPQEFSSDSKYKFPDPDGKIGCGADLPIQTKICPMCGYRFERIIGDEFIEEVTFTEIDLLNSSPFSYTDLYFNESVLFANGKAVWASVLSPDGGRTWHAVGGRNESIGKVEILCTSSERILALAAADDWMRTYETDSSAKKTAGWMKSPASEKQIEFLRRRFGVAIQYDPFNFNFTKYAISCHIGFKLNQRPIEHALGITG